ncbi:hypothetical protein C8R44DRAFT_771562 [Mycena epipterygia]|nr:hypothetical protein C8R44DRAFT_771562 [Mycena epipterygia]
MIRPCVLLASMALLRHRRVDTRGAPMIKISLSLFPNNYYSNRPGHRGPFPKIFLAAVQTLLMSAASSRHSLYAREGRYR